MTGKWSTWRPLFHLFTFSAFHARAAYPTRSRLGFCVQGRHVSEINPNSKTQSPKFPALWAALCFALATALPAAADMGTILFKDGTKVRGEIAEAGNEVKLSTPFGERRYQRDKILRIDYDGIDTPVDEPVTTQPVAKPTTRPGNRPPRDNGDNPADPDDGKAEDEKETGKENGKENGSTSRPRFKGLTPPPPLSIRNITRLKLSEYPHDGDPQPVNVEFTKKRGEPTLESLVSKFLADNKSDERDWEKILEKGQPAEKLQLILRTTGLKHADRINIRGDTETFGDFRKKVLPIVMRGCGRSGCHGGNATYYFRFPTGAQSADDFVYTAFYILDTIQTPKGPMIDRDLPEESALLKYLLAPADGAAPIHPVIKHTKIVPAIESRDSREYRQIIDWISSLRVPKPEYKVNYAAPDWLIKLQDRVVTDQAASQPVEPEKAPTSRRSK